MHDVVPWLNTFLSELNLQQPLSKFKNHCIVYENKLTICIHNHIDIFCFFSSCVRLKTGRENPVPTGTVSRKSRPYTVSVKKTGTGKKNKKKPAETRTETGGVFSRPFYRIVYRNSRQLFPFLSCIPIQSPNSL